MSLSSSLRVVLATATVAVLTLGASGTAQAQNYGNGNNVYWSIGMSAPGMQVGMASAPPMMYPPVYMAPRPVTYMPAPVYYAPPVWQQRYDYGRQVGYGYGYRGYERNERFEHGHGGYGGGYGGGHGGGHYR